MDSKLVEAVPAVLTYHEGRTYRPTGKVAIGGFFLAVLGGVAASVLSAVAVWVWMRFIERGLIFGAIVPLIGQGIVMGAALFYLFRWAKVRNAPLALGVGLMCALLSAVCFQGAIYVHSVHRSVIRVRLDLIDRGIAEDSPVMKRAEAAMATPYDFYDRVVLFPQTGRKGFPAFLRLRWSEADGWIVFHVLSLTIAAGVLAFQASSRPFCETCSAWYGRSEIGTGVGGRWADPLLQAIGADDAQQVRAVLQAAADGTSSGVVRVRCDVQRCPKCGGYLADVFLSGQGKDQNKTRTLVRLQRVSAETVKALHAPVQPTVAEA